MNLTPNPLILGLQVLPFIVTLLALKSLILDPMLKYLRTREELLHSSGHGAADAGLDKGRTEEQQRLARARDEIVSTRVKRLQVAAEQEKVILAEARKAIEGDLQSFRASVAQSSEAARSELKATAGGLAGQICDRLLA